ncbi:tRNA dihydrouridine(20/20a) synthase DusA [Pseudaestuariivita atlantica]|uniref:tRNA-dihydrouridine(20/20a) synthase n=1 Tax=Pseudaestuariivita atlantica TaxID=1317121 RepID=A0A0L1JKZ3_9RHOB|nr:tRNA dihydrouridine(20/20a) synthase DusA [Pseudaestuariivita atlantica]KNG92073.1 tRNA-dihydrouridine synthase A [Pseudaestuariivita atlantica]
MADKNKKSNDFNMPVLAVAPMMDWTDRHCRALHRRISANALLYTEMVTSPALVRGQALHLLAHGGEHPHALQLGGSDPDELAQAARLGEEAGYDEINLNCGCPSDRVQSGTFGAVLMRDAPRVADCVAAMAGAVTMPVTVKCRIGVDEQEPREVLPDFIDRVTRAGAHHVIVHARKAWLQGLSPKENRDIPPLDYDLVRDMRRAFPDIRLSVNGGIDTLEDVKGLLRDGFDGVMVGRAAYHAPMDILGAADAEIWGQGTPARAEDVVRAMFGHIEDHLAAGGRLNQVTRHMLGLFAGRPGARGWRRLLSEEAHAPGAGIEVLERALARIPPMGDALPRAV